MARKKSELVKKAEALRVASQIGCSGAHKAPDGNWMPCSSMADLEKISNIAETPKWRTVLPDAKEQPKRIRGRRKRTIQDQWEDLGEKPIMGIESLGPGGGLVSGNLFGAKALPGRSLGDRYASANPNATRDGGGSGIDGDSDGKINDGTDQERSAPAKRQEASSQPTPTQPPSGQRQQPAKTQNTQPKPAPAPKKKIQKIYKGGRRFSRALMPKGPNPENYSPDEYELVNEDGSPYIPKKKSNEFNFISDKSIGDRNIGPEYVRDNDPDVFIDPESARFRSRQLGCVGISRRISKTGRTVWMPCTNMTDYANRAGSTDLGRRNIEKGRKRDIEDAVRTVIADLSKRSPRKKSPIIDQLKNK